MICAIWLVQIYSVERYGYNYLSWPPSIFSLRIVWMVWFPSAITHSGTHPCRVPGAALSMKENLIGQISNLPILPPKMPIYSLLLQLFSMGVRQGRGQPLIQTWTRTMRVISRRISLERWLHEVDNKPLINPVCLTNWSSIPYLEDQTCSRKWRRWTIALLILSSG